MVDESTMAALEAQVRELAPDEQWRAVMAARPEIVLSAARKITLALYLGNGSGIAHAASEYLEAIAARRNSVGDAEWLRWLTMARLEANRA